MNLIISILLCILLLACGGYFAGTETGIYRVSRFRVRLGLRHHRPLYAILRNLLNDSQGVVLSTLIGTNLFCYLSTCLVTYILLHAGASHHAAEAITTLLMTPALFIYVDIIPKSIFYYRADALMPLLSGPLWLFHTILTRCGIISILKGLSQSLNRLYGASADMPTALAMTGRHEVRQILHETREEGFLTPTQQDMLHTLIDSQDLRVESILIPLAKAHMLPVDSDRSTVLECLRTSPPDRIAVYEKNREVIVGWISPSLVAAEHSEFSDVRPFLQPLGWIASDLPILDAIDRMADDNLRIAAVRDAKKAKGSDAAVVGIVTLRDMVEQVTVDRTTAS